MKARFAVCVLLALAPCVLAQQDLALDGSWRLRLDPDDAGVEERWFTATLPDRVELPGTVGAQGFGDPVSLDTPWIGGLRDPRWFEDPIYARFALQDGDFRFPFWLQPDRHYVGAAWFQRDIEIPESWRGRRVLLHLERPHWETRVWLDDRFVGRAESLSTPHEHELGTVPPGVHRLTVRVDNRLIVDVGKDSHSVSDHTQGNWNGLVGALELRSTAPVWIDDLQAHPDVDMRVVRVEGRIGNITDSAGQGTLVVDVCDPDQETPAVSTEVHVKWSTSGGEFEVVLPLGADAPTWDEFSPALHRARADLNGTERREVTFGLREIGVDGTRFTLNGRPLFLRGTLECAIFPATGHPPTDVESWRRIVRICKAHGLNHIRFHSWCPPEAAFVAADELGFYYQVEAASWANSSTSLGDGKPVDRFVEEETERILRAYGNHPSFVLMAYGNEPGGPNHPAFLADWVERRRARDSRRLYTSGSGWPQIAENQFHVTPHPRIHLWGAGLSSRINARAPETRTDYADYVAARDVPVISHEIGQWCVYPNFDEIPKYQGPLKPRNFEVFRDSLEANHLGDLARTFLHASGKLQVLCYKEEIEAALRTPGMGGFQLLDLHDFPGQGTALVGVLDPFWDEKGYVTAAEFRRFCDSTVPLARLDRRVFTTDQELEADLEVAHFGAAPWTGAGATWRLVDDAGNNRIVGLLEPQDLPSGETTGLGSIRIGLSALPAPAHYRLVVGIDGSRVENDWSVWIYPPETRPEPPAGVRVVRSLDDETASALEDGADVLLVLPRQRLRGDRFGSVAFGFSSIFWNTAWTGRQPPHTLGIYCDPAHPLFADFPTAEHTDWQWWYLIDRAGAMILDGLPSDLRPVVGVIDDWVTNRRLGLVFEARVGKGRLLVSSIDIDDRPAGDPVIRQFRAALFGYLRSEAFRPDVRIDVEQARALTRPPSAMERLGARVVECDSADADHPASHVLDGDPATLWHTAWTPVRDPLPHHLVVDLGRPVAIRGLRLTPRADQSNGRIARAEILVFDDPDSRGEPVAEFVGRDAAGAKTLRFETPARGRFVELRVTAEVGDRPYTSLAELEVLLER